MEQLIVKFKLPDLFNFSFLTAIAVLGYRKTGNKFNIQINGSKGYISNVVIECEGVQTEPNNIIWIENLLTKKRYPKSKMVSIFHSDENGVRISI